MSDMFEVTILGASGGPVDGNTQSFMIRPARARDLNAVCIDGGAGLGQIVKCVLNNVGGEESLKRDEMRVESFYENDFESIDLYVDEDLTIEAGFSRGIYDLSSAGRSNTIQKAGALFHGIGEYYITHAHLDHISGAIINSPLAYGTSEDISNDKVFLGLDFTMEALKKHIFNDIIWPNLVRDGTNTINLKSIAERQGYRSNTIPDWQIYPFKVHHGNKINSDTEESVLSTVYLVSDTVSGKCLVVCGDLEYRIAPGGDCVPSEIARFLVDNVPPEKLSGIFVECSNTSSIESDKLYGHLSPIRLIKMAKKLESYYSDRYKDFDSLKLNIIITHVKKIYAEVDPRLQILEELKHHASKVGLTNVRFSMAVEGYTYFL
ncbi:hypothetical protein Kpol_380p11 [Vanderwaltozyma polyspora DSM 70294]|uniref:3',5'-cyclic-nucleotide phosphodiesterase n=1 Tax=Vanderwaltozyma polyspora (strain ATCC 22028 / DSM 70294 / BCRC 21397 / CBS 2163 / NBRC 10782 / NRRL Y-8283 / UCD 57-17) TaxID=436907 RepID=A7TS70_VANPO|nr:uncharacterized protein Kpol_380p11 [Vanderwaltozyma polyspora DSM 70294]EDO14892.1 hypothetical protein Kpol_380p11 [Vanderwaltozyma polyspora DSM 70294]